jgi:serine/threonine protein kinase
MKSWRNVDKNAEARLSEEASILKKLTNSKHVVRLINTYARGKFLGLVMEPVAACDLNDLIEKRPKDRTWATRTLTQAPGCLAAALADIHALKIRHKDISPRNVLFCQDNVLLTDFGLSVDVSERSKTDTSGPTARTVNYCSPEVALQDSRGRKSDVFSLGCVILIILSLLPPKIVSRLSWNSADWSEEVLSFRPFYRSTGEVEQWIKMCIANTSNTFSKAWLQACSRMIREDPLTRSSMQEILDDLLSDPSLEATLPSVFCSSCLETREDSRIAALRDQRKIEASVAYGWTRRVKSKSIQGPGPMPNTKFE